MPVINDPAERAARTAAKRHALLRFLRDEVYTTPAVAAFVMGIGERGARQTITQLEKQGLVKRHVVKVVDTLPPLTIVGITAHGQGMAFDFESGEEVGTRVFEPGGYSLIYLSHKLDTQRLRIQSVNSGRVLKWIAGEQLGQLQKNVKRPDAVLLTAEKVRVAVEVERSIKNKKRYEAILASHLTAIKQNKWQRAVWASPDEATARRLAAIFRSVKRCSISGVDTLLKDEHFQPLSFTTYQDFVSSL